MRVPDYRQSLAAIKAPPGEEAEPFTHFLRWNHQFQAGAGGHVNLILNRCDHKSRQSWNWIGAIPLGSAGAPAVAVANGRDYAFHRRQDSLPWWANSHCAHARGHYAADFNYDFKTDLVLAGAGGVRLLRQDRSNHIYGCNRAEHFPKSVANASYTGAWAVDIEADGDLDIVLGRKDGAPTVLRNNGDGTFLADPSLHRSFWRAAICLG